MKTTTTGLLAALVVRDKLPTRAFGFQAFYSCFSKLRRCGAGYKKTKRARSRRDSESRNLDVVGFSPQLTSAQSLRDNRFNKPRD
jgi:hypothetical protein